MSLPLRQKAFGEVALGWRRDENYLFPGQDGQPMQKFQVVQLIERVLQAAGVDTARAAKRDDRSRALAATRSGSAGPSI